jgi:3-oxoacyl-[acyl-carrier protein] reductase
MILLKNKNIIITGALQGIGKETVQRFAEYGANIFACSIPIIDETRKNEFELFCKETEEEHRVFIKPVYFDMLDSDSVKNAVSEIRSNRIQIDGVVNIAGINKDANFGMISEKDIEDTFKVNVFSQIIFTQYIVRLISRDKNPASIVFTSSVTALDGNEGQVVYGASKAALIGAMKSMAKELGINNIRVNCVAPGVIKSPMTDKLSEELINEKTKKMDIPHIGESKNVADLYAFLMSDLSRHITGQVVRVDGGM